MGPLQSDWGRGVKRLEHMLPTLGRKSAEGGCRGPIRAEGLEGRQEPLGPEGILKAQEPRVTRNESTGGAPFP